MAPAYTVFSTACEECLFVLGSPADFLFCEVLKGLLPTLVFFSY